MLHHSPPAPPHAQWQMRCDGGVRRHREILMGRYGEANEGGGAFAGTSQEPKQPTAKKSSKPPARGWHHRERGSARRSSTRAGHRFPSSPVSYPSHHAPLDDSFLISLDGKVRAPALERLSAAARVCGVSSTTPPPMCRIALRCRHAAAPPPPLQRPSSAVVALPHKNSRAQARGGDGCGERLRRHRHRDVSLRLPS